MKVRFNHYGKAGPYELFYTTKAESGYYYPATDYEALEAKLAKSAERERVLVEALEAIRDGEVWRNKIYPSDIARSALAAKEE